MKRTIAAFLLPAALSAAISGRAETAQRMVLGELFTNTS